MKTQQPSDADRIGDVIDMVAVRAERNSTAWLTHLQRSDSGAIHATVANALIILTHDEALAGCVRFNAFTWTPLLMKAGPPAIEGGATLPGPYPRQWEPEDVALVQAYLQRAYNPSFFTATVEQAMLTAARMDQFHPVRDYLNALKWDSRPRLDTWLVNAFDCDNTAYHRAVAAKVLIAAVRRVRDPGCKFDNMAIFEGPQGIGKSTAVKELCGEQWFSDSLPEALASKDAALGLLGRWIVELGEIDQIIRAEVETVKAFLSRATDRFRPPYGKQFVERPRQGILVGTTNSEDYLRDSSGNRRFWPVACRSASPEWVRVNRDQLWAEAAWREAQGESVWLDQDEVRQTAETMQADRMAEDTWSDTIRDWIQGRVEVRTSDVLNAALDIQADKQNRAAQMRAASILKQLGWAQKVERRNGHLVRMWRKANKTGV